MSRRYEDDPIAGCRGFLVACFIGAIWLALIGTCAFVAWSNR